MSLCAGHRIEHAVQIDQGDIAVGLGGAIDAVRDQRRAFRDLAETLVARTDRTSERFLQLGAEGNMLLVASGLAAGQTIVSAGVHTLTAGQKVTLYQPTPAAAASAASR